MKTSRSFTVDRLAVALERRIFRQADLIIAFSDWARDSIINDCGISPSHVATIPNAVRTPRTTPIDPGKPLPYPADLPVVGFVGNDFERKGGYCLLEAHQRYLADRAHLVLVTSHEVRAPSLRNVTILSNLDRETLLAQVLPRFTLLAHPASLDWSPYAVIEALASGLPVVATSVGALPEMVVDGENGLLLPDDTPTAIAGAIESLLSSEERMRRMAQASHSRFAQRYDADVNYPELLETLRSRSR